uniref:Atpase43 n=1 Tax=Arabidopsis lyrata subsp. lyrata TaxID=81972 RepID=B2BXL8_ARALL|nr:Atpase43 [Arabidopsis lyrata subsp. lyrata]
MEIAVISSTVTFSAWHTFLIRYIKVENGEIIAFVKNSHGLKSGDSVIREFAETDGIDCTLPETFTYERLVNVHQNKRTGDCGPLTVKFIELHARGMGLDELTDAKVDEMRMRFAQTEYEKEVVECYVDGKKNNDQITRSKNTTSLILEGIFNNTSGEVFESEDGEKEIIGSPIDRMILKWAIHVFFPISLPTQF